MKPEDDYTEIGNLLRSRKPEVDVPPGLEGKVLRAIGQQKHRSKPLDWWRWLLVPPAVALLMVVFSPLAEEKTKHATRIDPAPTRNEEKTTEQETEKAVAAVDTMNPLERESQALKRDAERAGRFFLDCLPSVSSATKK
ncbi:hypothetical protein [Luteolibacter luteus]|uniref:DUF3619 family protein n=1 Tax=Luteolibacter luteus TaxID=2728835 RepID=A0A858RL67_9BACT|nr:hypothetical protein [Luteolibacter luteus]QJE97687.1 hypothetical protein HHL09_18505 [Luteolibacter luteus]